MNSKLKQVCTQNNSLVCVGLDTDRRKLPVGISQYLFNCAIVDATRDLVCAYKINAAFYDWFSYTTGADGVTTARAEGAETLYRTCKFIKDNCPEVLLIVDAKRADIGDTNECYAEYLFDTLGADAVTLHPYLGEAAMKPFLKRTDKACIILCRTSNPGAGEFQDLVSTGAGASAGVGMPLYQSVAANVARSWNANGNCMLVVGATYPDELARVRAIVGDMPILVPGIGAQGGDVQKTMTAGLTTARDGLIVNSSRGIIFASRGPDFREAARAAAEALKDEINQYRH